MNDKALGLIETRGLIPAIEAADISLKTADVSLEGLVSVGAGLVAISIRGDVSSVKAAVEGGAEAARRLGQVISTTVIARTAEGLDLITAPGVGNSRQFENMEVPAAKINTEKKENSVAESEQLEKMSVPQLRRLARELEGFSMSREEIKFARKNDLIGNVLKYYQERGV